jgi:hypothetical protein
MIISTYISGDHVSQKKKWRPRSETIINKMIINEESHLDLVRAQKSLIPSCGVHPRRSPPGGYSARVKGVDP